MSSPMIKPTDFKGLLEAFSKALDEASPKQDIQVLRDAYNKFSLNTDHDKKSPMDQAFRDMLLFKLNDDVEKIGALIRFSVEAVRMEIVSVTIPVVLLGDIFDTVTLDKCEQIFCFVEDMVLIWKEDVFFTSCKNNILRMCNDLLRRLSRTQNTVFCGRILLFLSKFFPFSERSGLNIVSEFNVDNVTEYGVDGKDMDDALEDETVKNMPIKIDYNLYCKFWSLQDFFRSPNQCYSKAQWKMFQAHAKAVLEAFSSFKLEEPNLNLPTKEQTKETKDTLTTDCVKMEVDSEVDEAAIEAASRRNFQCIDEKDHFFAKFLTNPKLLALQLSDSNFRRAVLTQFLMLFQYLQIPVKFKSESNTLTAAQSEFIKQTETEVYSLLEQTPPNGKRYAETVRHMLSREEMWNNWKNEGCKEFKKPHELEQESGKEKNDKPPYVRNPRKRLGDLLKEAHGSNKFYLGNEVLTRMWNYAPDNLQACKSEERNFLPQVETFLENNREKGEPSYEWRALRLLARQSPHFFTFLSSASYKISDYLDSVRRKIAKEKLDALKAQSGQSTPSSEVKSEPMEEHSNDEPKSPQESKETEEQDQESISEQTIENQRQENVRFDADEDSEVEEGEHIGDDDSLTRAKPLTATKEQIEEIAPLIGDDWKKLGKKLGYTADELLFFETDHGKDRPDGACITMLVNWFSEDDDATLDNWAYMLEGLEINTAATAVKALIDRLSSQESHNKNDELLLSD